MVMKTQTEKLKKQEKERDFFCVVSDAFRVFARHSSIALGSAWAFAGAVLVILVWVHRTNVSFFRYLAISDQYCDDDRHLPHGVSDSEHAKPRC